MTTRLPGASEVFTCGGTRRPFATALTSSGVTKVLPASHAQALAAWSSAAAPRGDAPSSTDEPRNLPVLPCSVWQCGPGYMELTERVKLLEFDFSLPVESMEVSAAAQVCTASPPSSDTLAALLPSFRQAI